MLRLAVTPRWLALAVLVVAVMVATSLLGSWQWTRTQNILAAERAAASLPIPVEEALGSGDRLPPDSVGRPVTAVGEYDSERQVIVANRSLDDVPGSWVVTGLRLTDGTLVPILRGWIAPSDSASLEIPRGIVSVEGVLQPDEIFYADAPVTDETIAAISRESLEQAWNESVPTGYVVLISQTPVIEPAPAPVPASLNTGDVPFPLQNFFYAFQWWIFAAFGLFLYVRWLRIEARRSMEGSVD